MYSIDTSGLPDLWQSPAYTGAAKTALDGFVDGLRDGTYPAFTLALDDADLAPLRTLADKIATRYSHVVFAGMGGSALGGRLLADFAGAGSFHTPQLHFLDNDDPVTIARLYGHLPLSETLMVAVSKSGSTAETLLAALTWIEELHHEGLSVRDHLMLLTEEGTNAMRSLAAVYDLTTLPHDPKVGGRFSVLSNVGLLPALLAGVDVLSLRHGARNVLKEFMSNPQTSLPAQTAFAAVKAAEFGMASEVLMPYSDRLARLGPWFAQLWAESLGKQGKGTTPIAALGATDQHSVLQLFADGPDDKLYTFILTDCAGTGPRIDPLLAEKANVPHLAGITAGDLIRAQGEGTIASLRGFGRPVRVIDTPPLDEAVLGALLMHFMLTTVCAASLWGINPFDQPAVEDGKRRALAILKENAA
ncbi:MAG: glucose-6-phosphate isomerase [Proteobacteria bacterium]|nr:glucose-6-phosphate isomerase [Pseudomonadota bacterium]